MADLQRKCLLSSGGQSRKSCCVGNTGLFRDFHFEEAWKYVSLGRILSHTVALTETLPVMLSTSMLLNVIFETDVAEECLLEDFLLYITDRENALLRKAMGSFACLTEGEQNRLQHFFTAHKYFDFPRRHEIKDQILAIAEEELVKRPAFLCAQIRKGIPESHRAIFWAQLSIDHLKYMQEKQRPTQEKVVLYYHTESLLCLPVLLRRLHGSEPF